MTRRAGAVLRLSGIALLTLLYSVLSHWTNSTPGREKLGVVLAIGPLLVLGVVLVWRSGWRTPAMILAILGSLTIRRQLPFLEHHFTHVFLAQQVGIYALLAFTFGRTLSGGRTPLCTRFADEAHGPLDAATIRYTRAVTYSWTLFFCVMAAVLVLLFLAAPIRAWSFFANFCTLPLIAAMFLVEYATRFRVLPHVKHSTLLHGVRAFASSNADRGTPRRG